MQKVGEVGVDSGQIMIVDPCYVDDGLDYNASCKITLSKDGYGVNSEGGFVTGTLFGDGTYPIYAEFENGRISSLTIRFDDETEVEEEEEIDYCEKCGTEIESWTTLCVDCEEEEDNNDEQ